MTNPVATVRYDHFSVECVFILTICVTRFEDMMWVTRFENKMCVTRCEETMCVTHCEHMICVTLCEDMMAGQSWKHSPIWRILIQIFRKMYLLWKVFFSVGKYLLIFTPKNHLIFPHPKEFQRWIFFVCHLIWLLMWVWWLLQSNLFSWDSCLMNYRFQINLDWVGSMLH